MNSSPPYSTTMKDKKGSKDDDDDDHDNDDTLEDVTDQETIKLFSSVENQQFQTPPRLLSVFSKEDFDEIITDGTNINNQNNDINDRPKQEDFEKLYKTTISNNLVPNSTLLNISTDSDWLNLRDCITTLKRHPYHIDILSDSSKVIQSLESATNHMCCNNTTTNLTPPPTTTTTATPSPPPPPPPLNEKTLDDSAINNLSTASQQIKFKLVNTCVKIAKNVLNRSYTSHKYNTRLSLHVQSFLLLDEKGMADLLKLVLEQKSLTNDEILAASLVTLALEHDPLQIEAILLLSKLELLSGHAQVAKNRLEKLESELEILNNKQTDDVDVIKRRISINKELDDVNKMKLFAIKACNKLQDILGKKQLTSTSPLKDIKGIGDKHLYKDMLLSNWSLSLPPMRMIEQIQQAYSLVSSMKLDHYKIIKEALSEKTPHRAVLGSWNLRCSSNYHEPIKTLPYKIDNVASLAKIEKWSIIALQEVPKMKNIREMEQVIEKKLGSLWKWVSNDLSESESGGFAYDSSRWSVELLSNDYNTTAYKRIPVCALFTSLTSPTTIITLASVHLKARDSKKIEEEDDDKEELTETDEVTCTRLDELKKTRNEVEALGSETGVASYLITKANEALTKYNSDALAYISILGDFNLSWTTEDPFTSPLFPESLKNAWDPLIRRKFRPLLFNGQATNAYEIMLSSKGHCFDNILVQLVSKKNEVDVSISKGEVDVSKGEVAPWPQEFQDYIEGLENVINAVKNTQSCSERLCKFAEKSIRTSLRNEIFTHGSDHRALTAIFESYL
jgi:hypothetical protein